MVTNADAVLAISAATRDALRTYLASHTELRNGRPLAMDWFHLGADLDGIHSTGSVRPPVSQAFAPGSPPTYLCVGTLEPRKNLCLVLDAFERLWAQGRQLRLCLIGDKGWKVDDLLERIAGHPQNGRLLLHLHVLNDAELNFAYRHARGLICASIIEGFGLPLVEALSRGLTVFASDIPVFREVGEGVPGDRLRFFDLASPDALARAITEYEQQTPPAQSPAPFVWPTWEQSTRTFLAKVRALADRTAAAQETGTPAQRPASP
jgi:O-antigen biosynthesis alpha-1,2-rhamnosyltransferase